MTLTSRAIRAAFSLWSVVAPVDTGHRVRHGNGSGITRIRQRERMAVAAPLPRACVVVDVAVPAAGARQGLLLQPAGAAGTGADPPRVISDIVTIQHSSTILHQNFLQIQWLFS